jgi:ABC-type nitrate/sulfonate/bicarbonate transport system substrate-binding protein
MSRLHLTLACGRYDRTEALRTGDVAVEGIDLNYIPIESPREIFDRMVGNSEFDAAELSSSELIRLAAAGGSPFVGLPVFVSRMFRHGFIYVNRRSGIRNAKDLEGKRVGVPLYTQTAAIWIRGHLVHQYGVDLSTIHWMQGGVEHAGAHGSPRDLPTLGGVKIEENQSKLSLDELLAKCEIDALIGSRQPNSLGRHPDVVRLFPNYREVEREYYQQTKIFPIMHLLAVRRDIYEANRWVANSLYKAFVDAKTWALSRMRFSAAQCTMLAWQLEDVEEMDALFGKDAWPYGIEKNRAALETLVGYMVEQRLLERPVALEEIFAPLPGSSGC